MSLRPSLPFISPLPCTREPVQKRKGRKNGEGKKGGPSTRRPITTREEKKKICPKEEKERKRQGRENRGVVVLSLTSPAHRAYNARRYGRGGKGKNLGRGKGRKGEKKVYVAPELDPSIQPLIGDRNSHHGPKEKKRGGGGGRKKSRSQKKKGEGGGRPRLYIPHYFITQPYAVGARGGGGEKRGEERRRKRRKERPPSVFGSLEGGLKRERS